MATVPDETGQLARQLPEMLNRSYVSINAGLGESCRLLRKLVATREITDCLSEMLRLSRDTGRAEADRQDDALQKRFHALEGRLRTHEASAGANEDQFSTLSGLVVDGVRDLSNWGMSVAITMIQLQERLQKLEAAGTAETRVRALEERVKAMEARLEEFAPRVARAEALDQHLTRAGNAGLQSLERRVEGLEALLRSRP